MSLSETIIKIHSIASESFGELEADEIITSLLVIAINDLKKNGELNPKNLEEVFAKKQDMVESSEFDFESKRPKLSLLKSY